MGRQFRPIFDIVFAYANANIRVCRRTRAAAWLPRPDFITRVVTGIGVSRHRPALKKKSHAIWVR